MHLPLPLFPQEFHPTRTYGTETLTGALCSSVHRYLTRLPRKPRACQLSIRSARTPRLHYSNGEEVLNAAYRPHTHPLPARPGSSPDLGSALVIADRRCAPCISCNKQTRAGLARTVGHISVPTCHVASKEFREKALILSLRVADRYVCIPSSKRVGRRTRCPLVAGRSRCPNGPSRPTRVWSLVRV